MTLFGSKGTAVETPLSDHPSVQHLALADRHTNDDRGVVRDFKGVRIGRKIRAPTRGVSTPLENFKIYGVPEMSFWE